MGARQWPRSSEVAIHSPSDAHIAFPPHCEVAVKTWLLATHLVIAAWLITSTCCPCVPVRCAPVQYRVQFSCVRRHHVENARRSVSRCDFTCAAEVLGHAASALARASQAR